MMDISSVTGHSSSMSTGPYEVFLSFRGIDTRSNFADFLHFILTNAEIEVFRDREKLGYGEEIRPHLIKAIKQSKISIPVISKNFPSSKSCLVELEQMVYCVNHMDHTIIPIFYYVQPSDVSNCTGPFKEAFKSGRDATMVDRWKFVLGRIGELKGEHLQENQNEYNSEPIMRIVRKVQQILKKKDRRLPKQFVRVDPHVQKIMAKLKVDYRDEQAVEIGDTCGKVLGIYGIPGVGKTVLAKYVYNKLHHLYEACSFLDMSQQEIRNHDILSAQKRLISQLHMGNAPEFNCSDHALNHIKTRLHNNVLILLDNVKDRAQLRKLVGELDCLQRGSTVIVTSRRCDVLHKVDGAQKYVLGLMKKDEALKLFCRHAFEMDSPLPKFKELSTNIVDATDGLPLALEKVGEYLFKKSQKVWEEKLTQLEESPYESVQEALRESYTTLKKWERWIFLDIACFFNGNDKRIPYYMWRDCKFFPKTSLESLHAMSLVEIGEDKELRMCAILQTFGREIVKKENKNEPCKRSRLCNHKEALDVLTGRKGTRKVEALRLKFADRSERNIISFQCDKFDALQNLRFLELDRADIQGDFRDHFLKLRWLGWQRTPWMFDIESLNLNLQNLVILDLSGSRVCQEWKGWKLLSTASKLKVLKLTGCAHLSSTPKFPASLGLERLILEGCSNLEVIDSSICNLEKLVSLNMKGCSLLCELPDLGPMSDLKELVIDETSISRINVKEGSMKILKFLSARNCKNLTEISDSIRYLEFLKYLSLDGSKIGTLPESIELLEELKTLSLRNRQRLTNLPDGIGRLSSQQFLHLSDTATTELPTSVNMTVRQEFPETTLNLENLEDINVSSDTVSRRRFRRNFKRFLSRITISDTLSPHHRHRHRRRRWNFKRFLSSLAIRNQR